MKYSNAPFSLRTLLWFVAGALYLRIFYLLMLYAWKNYHQIVLLVGIVPLIIIFLLGLAYVFQYLPHDWWQRLTDRSFPAKIDRQIESVEECLQYLRARRDHLRSHRLELEDQYHYGVARVLDFIKDQVDADLYRAREMENILDLSIDYCRRLCEELENLKGNYFLLLRSKKLRKEMGQFDREMEYLTGFLAAVGEAFRFDFKYELRAVLDHYFLSEDLSMDLRLPLSRADKMTVRKHRENRKGLPPPETESELLLDEIRLRIEQIRKFEQLPTNFKKR